MAFLYHKDLKYILHPYIFVLKENKGIENDLFDYSLWMMRIGSPETIRSPKSVEENMTPYLDEYDLIQPNFSNNPELPF